MRNLKNKYDFYVRKHSSGSRFILVPAAADLMYALDGKEWCDMAWQLEWKQQFVVWTNKEEEEGIGIDIAIGNWHRA